MTVSDYTGVIYIHVWSHMPIILPKGSSITQLIVIPYITAQQPLNERGNTEFGYSIREVCLPFTENR